MTQERVVLDNGVLRAEVVAESARIASLTHLPTGREILASTPWADEPRDGFSLPDSNGEWHRRYPGGWHVLLPRAGDPPSGVDPRQPFHGEAAWRTWSLQGGGSTCRARVTLRTVPLEVERTTALVDDELRLDTVVRNLSDAPVRVGWAEHPAFAGGVFDGATTVRTGECEIEVAGAPSAGFDDVSAAAGSLRITGALRLDLTWDPRIFTRLFVWRERRGSTGFPWWGAVDAVGLEPSSDPYAQPADALGSLEVAPSSTLRSRMALRIRGLAAATP